MKGGQKLWLTPLLLAAVCLAGAGCDGGKSADTKLSGKALFLTHCSGCHLNGGNAKNPAKSLDRMTLAANGITTPAGIVAIMRHPGQGMKPFDLQAVADDEARKIAEYILATFK